MSIKKILYSFLFIRFCFALSAILTASCLFGDNVDNNFTGNEFRSPVEFISDSAGCTYFSNDSLKRFVRFDHTDGAFNYYTIRLSMFNSSSERGYFYEAAKSDGIYMMDKSEFDKDSTLFMTGNTDKVRTLLFLCDLYERTLNSREPVPFPGSRQVRPAMSPLIMPTCNGAEVACSSNIYTFPAGTTGTAPPPVLGYPNYGCLGSEPCPAYFYMQVGVAGSIVISIQQSNNNDVDFICWGPFTSLTDGCAFGLTGTCNVPTQPGCCNNNSPGCLLFYPRGNITDCSYSPNSTETCHILNAQVGEMYILLITNYSQQPGTITFQQTGGTGVTNCDIVIHCSMIAITANPSVCDDLTNTFSISGNVEFSNPPSTGTLTITDNTAVPSVSQTFSPPFGSPLPYDLTGIPCDGADHFLTAVFSDSTSCILTQKCTAPPASCPQAQISGGGEICNDGTSTVPVSISLLGISPLNFTYAINGTPQPAVNNYSGASPYIINTAIPGTYTLVSISNSICAGPGLISGSATVTVHPLPLPTITGPGVVCAGSTGNIYSTEPSNSNYQWTVSAGGTITSGGGVSDQTVTVTWNAPGAQTVSINYHDPNGCTAASPASYAVTVNPLPVVTIAGNTLVCAGTTGLVYTTQAGMSNYLWNVSAGGTVTGGGSAADNTITVTWSTAGAQTVSVNYKDLNGCSANSPAMYAITVNPLPVIIIDGPVAACAGSPGNIYTTLPGMTNYLWNVSTGGTITSGGSITDNTVTVTWNTSGPRTVSLNYTDANSCTALAPTVYPVTVNTLPLPLISGAAGMCVNTSGTYTTAAGMTGYTWTVTAGGTITSGGGTNTVTILWIANGLQTITLSYTDGNGCTPATPSTFNVTVNTLPVPSLNGPASVCTGSTTTYTSDLGMNNYSWTVSAGGTITAGGSSTDASVTVLWTALGAQTVSVNYSMGTGCTGSSPTSVNVNVKPRPAVTNAANSTICSGITTNISLLASLPLTTFSWTATGSSVNVTGQSNSGGPVISQPLTNLGFNIETVDYAVTPSLNGCDGPIAHFIVTVDPVADAYFNPNGQTFCSGGTSSISILSHVVSAIFSWTAVGSSGNILGFGPGNIPSIAQTLTNIGTAPGFVTYTISPSFNSCPGTPNQVVVTVNPLPGVTYTICNDVITTTAAQPFRLKGGLPLGGKYSGNGVNTGIFYPSIAGIGNNTITYSYPNTWGCTANATQVISVIDPPVFLCDNTMTDIRDSKQYPTVKIGTQCWMTENLNYGTFILSTQMQRDNCISEKYCYNDILTNCTSYGGLYQWDKLMQYDDVAAAQGFCPPGWHVPTENEWNTLFNFYISNGFAGSPLKYTGYSGFNAFLSGTRFNNAKWNFSNFAVMLWSSTKEGNGKAWAHGMNSFNPSVSYYPSSRSNAFSVRCIMD